MRNIVNKNRENLHKVACLQLFEVVHPGGFTDNVGNHPNAFFDSSFEYLRIKKYKKVLYNAPSTHTIEESVARGDMIWVEVEKHMNMNSEVLDHMSH
jgi:hypothetical protein